MNHPTTSPLHIPIRKLGTRACSPRRGVAIVWLIFTLPVLIVLTCLVINISNLWLARVELESALESAALAAVKEWADADGGSTLPARQVGAEYASLHLIRGQQLLLDDNYTPGGPGNPNENLTTVLAKNSPKGSLVFGALTVKNPVVMNAGVEPTFGLARVLIDATGAASLADDNAWGISFRDPPETPATLRITQIEIDLAASGGTCVFDFSMDLPAVSDDMPSAVQDDFTDQPDNVGFDDLTTQIIFTPVSPTLLQINFGDGIVDTGFAPGDRFRFGAKVLRSMGGPEADGDDLGLSGARVTIYFEDGGVPQPPVIATFKDNRESLSDAPANGTVVGGHLIVHPNELADLPRPAGIAYNDNGQSFVEAKGLGERCFLVRAQATVQIPIVCGPFVSNDTYRVTAKATALYDSSTRKTRLLRVDEYIAPGP